LQKLTIFIWQERERGGKRERLNQVQKDWQSCKENLIRQEKKGKGEEREFERDREREKRREREKEGERE
jgi:hypothetical protein